MRNFGNNYFEIGVFDSSYTGVFWGDSVTFASFSYYIATDTADYSTWFWYTTHILASKFGLVRTYAEGTGGTVLIGAVLDGILWGDTTYMSITDEDIQTLPANINIINYPNPFNSKTIVKLELLGSENSSLKIYDLSGRTVYTFWENRLMDPGQYKLSWEGIGNGGRKVSSGVYFIVFNSEFYSSKKSIVLIK